MLARKWRPQQLSELVGQEICTTIIQNMLQQNRISHAYLLTGTRGVGKTTIARIIAKMLNCLSLQETKTCNECSNCRLVSENKFIDILEIDAASNTGVDNMREILDNAQYAPTIGLYKVYIIDEAHMLSKAAFNAMLKILEEPPAKVVFMLATTEVQKVPLTIISRCLQLKLQHLSVNTIIKQLSYILQAESIMFDEASLTLLATAANGSMRDALSLADQAISFCDSRLTISLLHKMLGIANSQHILDLIYNITNKNSDQILTICRMIQDVDLENALEQIQHILFRISIAQLSPNLEPSLSQLAQAISVQDCQLYFDISQIGLTQIKQTRLKYNVFVMTLLRMLAFSIASTKDKAIFIEKHNFQAPEQPVASTLFNGEWLTFVQKIDYKELNPIHGTAVVLKNSQLVEHSLNSIKLHVDGRYAALVTDHVKNEITALFNLRYNCSCLIEFVIVNAIKNSVSLQESDKLQHAKLEAQTAIMQDPIINELLNEFSATILADSIQSLSVKDHHV